MNENTALPSCKVTVLVAAYNAEAYLEQCLDSLRQQTLRELQIIVIDDASTDRTAAIAQQYAEQDSRILLLRQPVNGGQSKARNAGLHHATGEFITMVDSDDWLAPDAMEKAYARTREADDIDSVLLQLVYHEESGEERPYPMRTDKQQFSGQEAAWLSLDWSIHGLYLVRRDIHLAYPYNEASLLHSDDTTTTLHYLHSRQVCLSDGAYFYRLHSASMTHQCSPRYFDKLDADYSLKQWLLKEQVPDEMITRLENLRWLELVGRFIYWQRHLTRFTPDENAAIEARFRRFLATIEARRIHWRTRCKFGYIPFTRSYALFRLDTCAYDRLRRWAYALIGRKQPE